MATMSTPYMPRSKYMLLSVFVPSPNGPNQPDRTFDKTNPQQFAFVLKLS